MQCEAIISLALHAQYTLAIMVKMCRMFSPQLVLMTTIKFYDPDKNMEKNKK